jgi:hypothetical protein
MATRVRSIQFAVGKDGPNRFEDVSVIQSFLNFVPVYAAFNALAGIGAETRVRLGCRKLVALAVALFLVGGCAQTTFVSRDGKAVEHQGKFQPAGIKKLLVDGKCGPLTLKAIQAYEQKLSGWSGGAVDATVHPGETTWRKLNGKVGSTQEIKVANVAKAPKIIKGYSVFRQGDKAWGSEYLGNGDRAIYQWGCAMCTLTTAASLIGNPTSDWPEDLRPRDLNPSIANGILRNANAFYGSRLDMPKAASALGMTYEEYGKAAAINPNDVSIIQMQLQNRYPVAAHVAYGGSTTGCHWILIIQRHADGSFGCIDPANGAAVRLTTKAELSATSAGKKRTEPVPQGVLYGFGNGGSRIQQQYVVVRFACLSPAVGKFRPWGA